MAVQILGNYVGKKGKVYIESMQQVHRQTAFRLEGFLDKMKESFPDICIIDQDDKSLFEDSYEHVKDMVDGGASGIFYPSANVYLIGQALKELDNKDVVVIGYDLSEKTQQLLKESYIKAIMFQNPKLQAYKSLKIMCDYLLEGTAKRLQNLFRRVYINRRMSMIICQYKVWESDLWVRLKGIIEHFQCNTKGDIPIAVTDPQGPFTNASKNYFNSSIILSKS